MLSTQNINLSAELQEKQGINQNNEKLLEVNIYQMMCNTSLDTVFILLVISVLCVNNKEANVSQDFKGNFIRVAWSQSLLSNLRPKYV